VSLLTFAQNVAQFIVGPFGISMITFCIAACALAAAMHAMRWSNVFTAVFMGAILFSSSWIVTTFLGG
jgi:type IV secretory pathway VirB2 component (pilin)